MEIIHDHLVGWDAALPRTLLPVDRLTLSKRRWRGTAADGMEFGFVLEHPLADGDVFFQSAEACYQLAQQPESILEVALDTPIQAVMAGWKLGNLHFPIAVTAQAMLAPDDPAIRQMLGRENIPYQAILAVFRPFGGHHPHGHHAH